MEHQGVGKIILRKLIVAVSLRQIAGDAECLPVVFARSRRIRRGFRGGAS